MRSILTLVIVIFSRAQQRAAEERQAAEARRLAEERAEAERQRLEAERIERELQEAAELKRRQAEAKAAVLPAEPPAGTPNVTTIAFRLPDGKRLNRRFAVTETVQVRAQGRGVLRMR